MKYALQFVLACCLLAAAPACFGADTKKPDDKASKPINTLCPLTGEKIDPTVTTQYKGKTVAFCCADCIKDFNKDPAKYMKKIEADEAKNKKGNGDKKGDKGADKPRGEQPAAGKAVNAMCPVEKDNAVDPTATTTVYKGKTIGFCCDDCIKKFEQNPDSYAANLK